ncbi:MAG: hypothetical protein DWQ36_17480 [Acidobacteria bacterium]|nr:MAG: hypothetical protein DWQ30_16070 [Acidobacteriota bacterium]REK04236.1 MAG: hypothetical protein DWQ36_17480 [Acidobacteriota bacterium]
MSDTESIEPIEPIEFRELRSDEDFEQCLRLQQLTWGRDFRELVPPTVMRISQKVGGVAAGAFGADGRQLGFVWGLSGLRDGRPAHWSHMLAVHPSARGLGVGKGLKYYQRELLLALGVEHMYWTYDPLVARNATLNLMRLGARPVQYVVDMYGAATGSELHSGLGTDRFVVEWDLRATPADGAGAAQRSVETPDGATAINRSGDEVLTTPPAPDDGGDRLWIEVPGDIEALKRTDRARALAYRDSLRSLVPRLLGDGWCFDALCWIDSDRAWYRAIREGVESERGRNP